MGWSLNSSTHQTAQLMPASPPHLFWLPCLLKVTLDPSTKDEPESCLSSNQRKLVLQTHLQNRYCSQRIGPGHQPTARGLEYFINFPGSRTSKLSKSNDTQIGKRQKAGTALKVFMLDFLRFAVISEEVMHLCDLVPSTTASWQPQPGKM
jgi:hypothetical protein